MAKNNKEYLWFPERQGINIIEAASDGDWDYKTISSVESLRVYAIRKAGHFTNDLTEESEFPSQFHEAMAFKVIADMYRLPKSLNLQLAQYFDDMYKNELKEFKKFARSQMLTSGVIKGVDY